MEKESSVRASYFAARAPPSWREETLRIAQRLAAGPTRAYVEAKRLVNQSLELLEAQMEQELQAFSRCARGADLKEGVTVFVEKRKPVFRAV